jgi:hypothetical protein
VSNAFAEDDARKIMVPLIDDGSLVRIPVEVLGQTRYFVVDTGTSATILDARFADRLAATGEVISENTSGESVQAAAYNAPDISIDGVSVRISRVYCNDLSLQRMVIGEGCDGILGMDILHQYSVTIDLFNKTFLMTKDNVAPADSEKIQLGSNDGIPEVPIAIDGGIPEQLIIDSGSNAAISLNQSAWDKILSPGEKHAAVSILYSASGGSVKSSLTTKIRSIKCGSAQYSGIVCQMISQSALSSVGLPFFRHNSVVLDFPHNILYFQSRPGAWVDEQDMSGLHLLKQNGKVVVYSVNQTSPAESCGIKAGDQVENIDGEPCSKMTMKTVRAKFAGLDGEHRSVELVRGSQHFRVSITLKRVI